MNTWPEGRRHAMYQSEHAAWNAKHFPGTMQLCEECGDSTGRCEDDSLFADEEGEIGPLCEACWDESKAVRVDFFKPSGKWYATETVHWNGGQTVHEAFKISLRNHLRGRMSGMTAVCLEPYHDGYPLMIRDGKWEE